MADGFIWYDKSAADDRVWCVKRKNEPVVRASVVSFDGGASKFMQEGHAGLQPGGPRGVIWATGIETFDEVPCV